MWPTSTGNRTLCGAEAALVAAAVLVMLDALDERLCDDDDEFTESTADLQVGIAVFDALTVPQRIATLHHVCKHLLTDSFPSLADSSAVDDATIAAIFSEVRDQLTIEIGLDNDDFGLDLIDVKADGCWTQQTVHWRSLVLEAYHQIYLVDEAVEAIEAPSAATDRSISAWEDLIESLVSAVLWDRDFELVDGFLDADPSAARQRRRLLGIHDNYFVEPPPDPTAIQTRHLLEQAKALAARWAR